MMNPNEKNVRLMKSDRMRIESDWMRTKISPSSTQGWPQNVFGMLQELLKTEDKKSRREEEESMKQSQREPMGTNLWHSFPVTNENGLICSRSYGSLGIHFEPLWLVSRIGRLPNNELPSFRREEEEQMSKYHHTGNRFEWMSIDSPSIAIVSIFDLIDFLS